jgi:hypothetical protein
VGCAPSGPAKYLWVLGRFCLETLLRSACLGWLCQTPCSHAGYLGVSTIHTFKINITSPSFIVDNLFMRHTFQDPAGYPWILNIEDLRPPRGQYANKTPLRSALLDSLQPCWEIWVSLHFVRSRPRLSFLLFLRIKPAMLPASMLGDYSRRASSTPSCFLHHTNLLGNPFVITSLLDLIFLLFSFLDHHTGHPACHDARILLYECILDAL